MARRVDWEKARRRDRERERAALSTKVVVVVVFSGGASQLDGGAGLGADALARLSISMRELPPLPGTRALT
jgi:hypothetical protein